MRVRLDGLDDETLHGLASSYDELAGSTYPAGWRAFASDMADLLRSELARRRVQRALDRDTVGAIWFGRL